MARGVYTIQCNNASVAAVQDLLSVTNTAATKAVLRGIDISATGQVIQSNCRMRIVRLPATVTAGSGGSAVTPQKTDPLDAAATFTARSNDTVQATTNGTASTEHSFGYNPLAGYTIFFPEDTGAKATISEALVLSLDSAPAVTLTVNATLWVQEL